PLCYSRISFSFTAPTTLSIYSLSLHDALPISVAIADAAARPSRPDDHRGNTARPTARAVGASLEQHRPASFRTVRRTGARGDARPARAAAIRPAGVRRHAPRPSQQSPSYPLISRAELVEALPDTGKEQVMARALTSEQQDLVDAVTQFCRREVGTGTPGVHHDQELYRKMADLGWLGISLPEKYGGSGLGMTELCLFLETTAYWKAPISGFATTIISAAAYERFGTE